MLSTKELEKLEKFPRIDASISIDSFDKDTFEKIRAGGSYDLILENTLRALSRHDAPRVVFSVGMIICKSNFAELADNMRYAVEHGIGLNLSPVLVYPDVERLDIFENFKRQTRGWRKAIDRARRVIADAKARDLPAVRRIDPEGMVRELARIYDEQKERYANVVKIQVIVTNPTGSLARMKRPGIAVRNNENRLPGLAYLEFDRGPGRYVLRLPRAEIAPSLRLKWRLLHDFMEDFGTIEEDFFRDRKGRTIETPEELDLPAKLRIEIPRFACISRPKNIRYANYGEPTEGSTPMTDTEDVAALYRRMAAREQRRASSSGA